MAGTTLVVPSTTATASGTSSSLGDFAVPNTLRAQLNVTAASGTAPTLDVVIEDTLDGGTTWNTVLTFSQAAAVGRQVVNFTGPFADTIRVRWTVGGTTPSFTFDVRLYSEP